MGTKNIYERFIWFEQQVKARRFPNASTLARSFEVSTKTAQRDIEFMRDRLNCPLEYDAIRKGYFYKDNTFSLPLIHLTVEELSALVIARKLLLDIAGSAIAGEITSAVGKITSILEKHIPYDVPIDDVVSFHHVQYAPASEPVFRTVLEGCLKRTSISLDYRSPSRPELTTRVVDPYHLFNYMGTWHLIGYCHLRKDIRDFNISRISASRLEERPFAVMRGFTFQEFFDSAFGIYKGSAVETVTLRFSQEKTRWVKGQVWHRDQQERMLKDGSMELSFPVADFSEIVMEVLRHGSGIEVIRPKSLRKIIAQEAHRIARLYEREG